ncbi:hypothetical protein P168DRAFT_276143 [Aspergillus campestris IBT 28561]|uniref:DUF4139 domain-containing protein n=1 Tax=Aspergillus campestris (strain IBT 28561) TaxID=1392248 RepID=A0A2I1CRM0_ASPC2|nr:uncharacterized protein P168DRAFT_276143 [Aspergillus campestris IBT 28561]PKY00258.1 hypothetical protein P168DRAFT_276143 [Aspergillus campestris IBT 28561]
MPDQILLADLSTKSVTLTPLRATVTRDIHACIKPNQTDLTIIGLDPRVDTNSIRIQGSGPATITDIQTGVVPRTDDSPDLSDSDSSSSLSSDESDSDDIDEKESEASRKLDEDIVRLEASLARARALKRVGPSVMNMLDEYGKRLAPETAATEQVGRFLALYEEQSLLQVEKHCEGEAAEGRAERELMRLRGKREKIRKRMLKGRKSAAKEKKKRRARKESLRAQRARQRAFQAEKKRAFWTDRVRKVVVSLDRHVVPLRSRASSTTTTSTTATATDKADKDMEISLQLSYVVDLAKWSPRYELSIDTPKSTARLTYRAEFVNATAETWKDAHVTLSTSQAAFSRPDEPLPALVPWQVKLQEAAGDASSNHKHPSWDRMLRSSAEDPFSVKSGNPFQPLFSMARQGQQQMLASQSQQQLQQQAQQQARQQAQQKAQQQVSGALFSCTPQAAPQGPTGGGLFGMSSGASGSPASRAAPPPPTAGAAAPPANTIPSPTAQSLTDPNILDDDNPTTLDHQDSIKNEIGLTTTYDLPGRRTLAPSTIPRRHVLADLELKNVQLSHLVVPKHRAAAFLRARIQNTSAVTLLRGPVGMAVDATFIGTSSVPPTTPGEYFGVSMGIDPDVVVRYSPPKVKRLGASSVFFAKDEMALFTRVCVLKNAKPTAVEVTLLEQVPVSEDERLKVRVVKPSGLEKEGDKTTVEMDASSGSGGVSLGKNGEVRFVVKLRPGKEVKLMLEYEASAPSGSEVGS